MNIEEQQLEITLPSLKSATYTVNTDPGSRQWDSFNDPNVWNRLNGVRYDLLTVPGEYETIIYVDNHTNKEITVMVEVPYMRPW